jgi:hypothetical protein
MKGYVITFHNLVITYDAQSLAKPWCRAYEVTNRACILKIFEKKLHGSKEKTKTNTMACISKVAEIIDLSGGEKGRFHNIS